MKHSKSTKAIALLMSMTMITSVFVGNTLSRYVTSVSSTDSARVAVWGINAGEDTVMNLFSEDYIVAGKTIAASNTDGEKIMAPGTAGEAEFEIINFEQNIAPEVAYEVKITLDDSAIDEKILNNPSVQWKLDNGTYGTWDELKTAILSLAGDESGRYVYEPGQFATAFQGAQTHKIAWQWVMDNNNNVMDTEMGNLALTNDLNAIIKVSIVAIQVDGRNEMLIYDSVIDRYESGFYSKTGVYTENDNMINSNFIPVEYGATYKVLCNFTPSVVLFDDNKEFISSNFDSNGSINYLNLYEYITITDERVKYMIVNSRIADKDLIKVSKVEEIPNYSGKITFFGDSITIGAGRYNNVSGQTTGYTYARVLGEELKMNTNVLAVNGSHIADSAADSIANKVVNYTRETDMIMIMGGANDYVSTEPVEFGTISDNTIDTFYGALNYMFSSLETNQPDTPVVVLTPLNTGYRYDAGANSIGKTLADYSNAIKEVATLYDNVYVIDTYTWSLSNLDYEDTSLVPDGLHPNIEGHHLIYEFVLSQLKSLELV